MSKAYPVIAITGSSGAGTTTVMNSFNHIFRRDGIRAQIIEGDSMHRYERKEMDALLKKYSQIPGSHFSHFSPEANLLPELAETFRQFGETGRCKVRKYIHTDEEGLPYGQPAGTLTPWRDSDPDADVLFYEGLHGGYVGPEANVTQHVDLLVGVVPIINLEWIQKMHRDQKIRGYSQEAVIDTILRRMPDYVHHICPQFSRTHVNFQRVPTVDTSNPFIAKDIPSPDESMVVIRFANPRGIDFPYLLNMLHGSMMTRPNSLVIPGGKMGLAMQLIFTPMIQRLMQMRSG
ncbi:MAG TPA: phosphoribulokinase [Methylophilaceae bacterium]